MLIKNKMNKKADITITILVIGVFIVCTLAIFSFISETSKSNQHLASVGFLETINSMKEEIQFTPLPYKMEKNGLNINMDGYQIKGNYSQNKKILIEVTYIPQ